jgi:hypothetical protein
MYFLLGATCSCSFVFLSHYWPSVFAVAVERAVPVDSGSQERLAQTDFQVSLPNLEHEHLSSVVASSSCT